MKPEIAHMIQRINSWYLIETNSVLRSKLLMAKEYLESALEINEAIEEEKKNG